ncbi:hypothetical protein MHBO_004999, partial [Bonamia ostreae]
EDKLKTNATQKGTISEKTRLSNHPWVKDVDKEMQAIEDEEPDMLEDEEPIV